MYSLQESAFMTSWKLQSPTQSKHWKTEIYQGLNDCCKYDCGYDLNYLASVNLCQCTTVITQCLWLNMTRTWRIQFCNCWSHLIIFMVGFTILRARYYYILTGPMCYVYSDYNLWDYSELSIYVYFNLSWDTSY